jgi:hypothetical protein
MIDDESIAQRIADLQELEEAIFIADFHQSVEKDRKQYWHDRHIKSKIFNEGDKLLLYDSRYQKHPRKLHMHWLAPFIVVEIRYYGVVKLVQLDGILRPGLVNGTHLKPYISHD